jgi:hypothetical protein
MTVGSLLKAGRSEQQLVKLALLFIKCFTVQILPYAPLLAGALLAVVVFINNHTA